MRHLFFIALILQISLSQDLIINESMSKNNNAVYDEDGDTPDWIEIYNDTNKTISLDGVRLSKDLNGLNDWSFPIGSKVGKGSYLVVLCDGGAPASKTNTGFSLSAEGGGIYMLDPNGFVVDSVEYGFQIAGQSIGRVLGEWQLLDELTPGTENSSKAILGDPFKLVINEWLSLIHI